MHKKKNSRYRGTIAAQFPNWFKNIPSDPPSELDFKIERLLLTISSLNLNKLNHIELKIRSKSSLQNRFNDRGDEFPSTTGRRELLLRFEVGIFGQNTPYF